MSEMNDVDREARHDWLESRDALWDPWLEKKPSKAEAEREEVK